MHRSAWRNCLENGRRPIERASSTPGSDRSGPPRPLLAPFGTPILRLSRFSKQFRKKNSRKFAVTSGRRFRFQGCRLLRTLSLSARIEDKFVGFVAKDCCEQWQLATLQVPENFSKERHIP